MKEIVDGVVRFQKEQFPQKKPLFETLAGGQSPETLLITCSDSRIDPCLFTQTGPGDLFVIRNAGNIVPPHGDQPGGEEATIEYAVKVLKVKHIVICGHSKCGAVGALMDPDSASSLPAVLAWLKHAEKARGILERIQSSFDSSDEGKAMAAVHANVLAQVENLKTHPCVADAIAAGDVVVHGWVYAFERGEVLVVQSDGSSVAINEQTASEVLA